MISKKESVTYLDISHNPIKDELTDGSSLKEAVRGIFKDNDWLRKIVILPFSYSEYNDATTEMETEIFWYVNQNEFAYNITRFKNLSVDGDKQLTKNVAQQLKGFGNNTIDLSGYPIEEGNIYAIESATDYDGCKITNLICRYCSIKTYLGDKLLKKLIDKFKYIDLSNNDINDQSDVFSTSLEYNKSLEYLDISNNTLSTKALENIDRTLEDRNFKLTKLYIYKKEVPYNGTQEDSYHLSLYLDIQLKIRNNEFAAKITRVENTNSVVYDGRRENIAINLKGLYDRTINLENFPLGDSNINATVDALNYKESKIVKVVFKNCSITTSNADKLFGAIKENPKIKYLDLSQNHINDTKNSVSNFLYENHNLEYLNISNNTLQYMSLLNLEDTLKKRNFKLTGLEIDIDDRTELDADIKQDEESRDSLYKSIGWSVNANELAAKITTLEDTLLVIDNYTRRKIAETIKGIGKHIIIENYPLKESNIDHIIVAKLYFNKNITRISLPGCSLTDELTLKLFNALPKNMQYDFRNKSISCNTIKDLTIECKYNDNIKVSISKDSCPGPFFQPYIDNQDKPFTSDLIDDSNHKHKKRHSIIPKYYKYYRDVKNGYKIIQGRDSDSLDSSFKGIQHIDKSKPITSGASSNMDSALEDSNQKHLHRHEKSRSSISRVCLYKCVNIF